MAMDWSEYLAAQARADKIVIDASLDEALRALDAEMTELAESLRVEYVGPGVDTTAQHAEQVYRLVMRHHVWDVTRVEWGIKVCDTLPRVGLRAMWPVYGVSRLRKPQVIRALPGFFRGLNQAVQESGQGDTLAGLRIRELMDVFG